MRAAILAVTCAGAVWGVWLVSETWGQAATSEQSQFDGDASVTDQNKPADDGKSQQNSRPANPTVALPTVVKEPKLISLAEAIALLETSGRGEVIKGEKTGGGMDTQYMLLVLNKEAKSHFIVNANGKVIVETAAPTTGKKTDTKPGSETSKKKSRESGDAAERERRLKKIDDVKKFGDSKPAEPKKPVAPPGSKKTAPESRSTVAPNSTRGVEAAPSQTLPNDKGTRETKKKEIEIEDDE